MRSHNFRALYVIIFLFIASCNKDKEGVQSDYDFSDYKIEKIEAEQDIPLEGEKTLFIKEESVDEILVRIFDLKDKYKDYTVKIEDQKELFELIKSYFDEDSPNIGSYVRKITALLEHTNSSTESGEDNRVAIVTSKPKESKSDQSPMHMVINYHTFELNNYLAPIQNSTVRVNGTCGPKCGNSARAMGTHSIDDLFIVSWMSPRDTRAVGPWWDTKEDSKWWNTLYKAYPSNVGFEDFRHSGNITVFREISPGSMEKVGDISFKDKCEAIHDITSNENGKLISLLCEGYPGREFLKEEFQTPFNGIIDLLYGENDESEAYCNDKNCGAKGIRGDGSASYILEYHGGLFKEDGTFKEHPDKVLLINTAAGGWRYSHNELHFLCNRSDGKNCNNDNGMGGRYIAQVKSTKGNHEKTVGYIINRPHMEGEKYAIKSDGGFGGGSPGHGRASRLAYNEALIAVGKASASDACPAIPDNEKEMFTFNGKFFCQAAAWSASPMQDKSMVENGNQIILRRQVPESRQNPWGQTGGIFGILSLGKDGWMVIGAGPGTDHKQENLPRTVAVGVMPVKEIGDETTDSIAKKWKWYNNLPEKMYTKLELPGDVKTKSMGYANLAYFGKNSEDSERLLFGGVISLRTGYPYDPVYLGKGDQMSKEPLFFLAEMNRAGDIIAGSVTMLELGYGWGEDNRWTTMDSGCVVFPWVSRPGTVGKGYPRGGYLNDRSDLGPDSGISNEILITSVCPKNL